MKALEILLKTKIDRLTDHRLERYTPGLCIEVAKNGQSKISLKMGKTYPNYDLASLTKIIFCVSVVMRLYEAKKIDLNKSLSFYLDWWPHKKIKVKNLLNHTAGLKDWQAYYKKLARINGPKEKREALRLELAKAKPTTRKKSVYSDIDFLLLGFLIEKIEQKPLFEVFEYEKKRLGIKGLHFSPQNKRKYAKSKYAPTEKCSWRKKTLQGEVHDDNTWAMGGVSTHAGLFGAPKDVLKFGLLLRKALKSKKGSALCKHQTAKFFTKRVMSSKVGDFALGYMLPSKKGSSAGTKMSRQSIGHTGFTGTSLWYDPKKDILIVILSNRVHPKRANKKFVGLRPKLHDAIMSLV